MVLKRQLVILGSTGSIGTQALDVAEKMGMPVLGLAARDNVGLLEEQIRKYRPRYAALYDEKAAADLKVRVGDCFVQILSGMDGLCALAALPEADLVLNSVVGMVGLQPTMAAIAAGHDIALANKETLVAGGKLVMEAAARQGVRILPVDSEHSAVFQCLQATLEGPWAPPSMLPQEGRTVNRLILTASGGPFFGKTAQQLEAVTVEEALKHPNWEMGAKITIDSATMMNKGLEIIEARWLFQLPPDRIDVVVHRESVVHSLVEFTDYSVLAQMGVPDMRIPIQYAMTWPDRIPSPVKRLDLDQWGKLTFCQPDAQAFPAMDICRTALQRGGLYTAAVNAANEEANLLFRQGKISFTGISRLTAKMLEQRLPAGDSIEDILETDRICRELTREMALHQKAFQ